MAEAERVADDEHLAPQPRLPQRRGDRPRGTRLDPQQREPRLRVARHPLGGMPVARGVPRDHRRRARRGIDPDREDVPRVVDHHAGRHPPRLRRTIRRGVLQRDGRLPSAHDRLGQATLLVVQRVDPLTLAVRIAAPIVLFDGNIGPHRRPRRAQHAEDRDQSAAEEADQHRPDNEGASQASHDSLKYQANQ